MIELLTYTDPMPGRKGSERVFEECVACGGTGFYFGETRFDHEPLLVDGVWRYGKGCFDCVGSGQKSILVSSIRQRVRKNIKMRNTMIRAGAGLDSDLAIAWGETFPAEFQTLKSLKGDFAESLTLQVAKTGKLSENQIKALQNIVIKESAPKGDCPTGKVQITGKIVSLKTVDGYYGTEFKMLVETEENYRVYGSVPKAIMDANKGDKVTFSATVEPSHKDKAFGFYKRPTKASVVQ